MAHDIAYCALSPKPVHIQECSIRVRTVCRAIFSLLQLGAAAGRGLLDDAPARPIVEDVGKIEVEGRIGRAGWLHPGGCKGNRVELAPITGCTVCYDSRVLIYSRSRAIKKRNAINAFMLY